MDPLTIFTALLPVIQHGARAVINKFAGESAAKPANVEEAVKLMGAEVERLKALRDLDNPVGPTAQWVNNIRALMRPIGVVIVLVNYCVVQWLPVAAEVEVTAANLAASVTFYLFGERTMMHVARRQA